MLFSVLSCVNCLQKNNVGAMYGAAVSLVILQQPDKAKSQLKNINNITWNMEVGHISLSPCITKNISVSLCNSLVSVLLCNASFCVFQFFVAVNTSTLLMLLPLVIHCVVLVVVVILHEINI